MNFGRTVVPLVGFFFGLSALGLGACSKKKETRSGPEKPSGADTAGRPGPAPDASPRARPPTRGSGTPDAAAPDGRAATEAKTNMFFGTVPKPVQGPGYGGSGTNAWVKKRAKNASKGKRELVRLPLVQRSMGWGCACPMHFIGANVDTGGGPWLKITPKSNVDTRITRRGWVKVAEGYFTGRRVKEDLRDKNKQPPDYLYHLWEFHVLRTRSYKDGSDADDHVHLVLDTETSAKPIPQLADNRPWLAIAEVIPLTRTDARQKAEAAVKRLHKAGFPEAEFMDSRQTRNLFCCYLVVVAGRFATRAEAGKLRRNLAAKKTSAYLRKGW